ncbi:MAG: choice-of-anchor Q domain-containing protein, partial [Candidatus Marinimicrobia bacterium]|nr:choice-of-anchor Q domain-containing protein [Candidatus Neomarinimicrobiota bacterium]
MGNAVKVEGQFYWDPGSNQNIELPSGVTFKNCIFTENGTLENTEEPPVIYINRATASFESCVIKDNHVVKPQYSGEGAAIWIGEESNVVVTGTKILNNSLTANEDANGAGIYMNWSGDNRLTVTNSIISGNTATPGANYNSRGSGIMIRGGTATIINSTIVDNEVAGTSQMGGGIFVENDNQSGTSTKLNLFNSIIYGNTPINNQLYIEDFSNVEHFVSYSLIQGTDLDEFEDGVFESNPEFLDSTYALHPRSPAIGTGAVESEDTENEPIYAPTVDIAGNIRPNPADASLYDGGAVPDLGAYEHELAVTPYPAIVEDLAATPLHRSVELEWDYHEEEEVEMYIAYMVGVDSSLTFTPVDTVLGRFNTRTTIDSLVNGTDYWFYVTAVDTADYESSPTLHVKISPFFQGPVW